MTSVNVVDSSGWLEYFVGSDRADLFAPAIEDNTNLYVPVISIYEVFKKVLRDRGEGDALQIAGVMNAGRVIALTAALAIEAARHRLPMADSIIYATAVVFRATLWTQDAHFNGMAGVRFFPKSG